MNPAWGLVRAAFNDGKMAQPGSFDYASGQVIPTDSPVDYLAAGAGSALAEGGMAAAREAGAWSKIKQQAGALDNIEFRNFGDQDSAMKAMNDRVSRASRLYGQEDELRHMRKAGFNVDESRLEGLAAEKRQLHEEARAALDKSVADQDKAATWSRLARLKSNMQLYRHLQEAGLSHEEILKILGNDPW